MRYPKGNRNCNIYPNLYRQKGSALVLVVICMILLSFLGLGMLTVAYGVKHTAIKLKNETISMLAAEAGYETAVFWMSQQKDMLGTIYNQSSGVTGSLNVSQGSCSYRIELFSFVGSRPVYRVLSVGNSGTFSRTVDVHVVQALSGWDMGMCRIPTGNNKTQAVYFANNEVIDMPLHINDYEDQPDNIDIHIQGNPQFLQTVSMGEPRYVSGSGFDKYYSVMSTFDSGICFDQPNNKVTDKDIVQDKIERFRDSTNLSYRFTPVPTAYATASNPYPAVQLEFFVEDGAGKIRITNNCTVRGSKPNEEGDYDYKIKDGSDGTMYEKYNIYTYHYMPEDAEDTGLRFTVPIENTYVTQSFNGVTSEPGGQIYVDGSVVIGGDKTVHDGGQLVKGRITVVATGNIWIADSIKVDGPHDTDGKPSDDNPNILGLISQGVIKVVDPGLSESYPTDSGTSGSNGRGGTRRGGNNWNGSSSGNGGDIDGHVYNPIGISDGSQIYDRVLPDPMVVEAALTVGGGGWGAENVGDRKEYHSPQDDLILRGTITEVIRGVVGIIGSDGYLKNYYFDDRVLEGILPGDIWLQGKFIPAPAGWHDYRVSQ
ncbi:MAG: hypothetical protein JXA96_11765 [Sedimentisphaerales bacterium]|nr:hypothetical protein [Sedimentisphaerales bacterium]